MKRSTLEILLALALPASLLAQSPTPAADLPCGAVKAALPPCDAAGAKEILATVDGTPVAAAELDKSLRARRAGLEAAVAGARRAALEAEIDDTLLELEAERRKVPLTGLLEAEVLRRTPPPTEADVRAVARSLRERFEVTMGADPNASRLPKDAVLATVGGRRITRASAATRLDAAAFGVRRNLYFDEKDAADKLVHQRLLKTAEMPTPPVLELDASRGASRGSPNAAVSVVEWADFECPRCGHMWAAIEEALKPYGDRVRFVFLNFPLPSHEFAQKAAEAAAAARVQGRFFEYAGILFRNQKALDVPSLKKYAALAGLDPARFSADLDSGRFAGEVFIEKRSGVRAGVLGTPWVFVNGVWLRWDRTGIPDIRAAVDGALARTGSEAAR